MPKLVNFAITRDHFSQGRIFGKEIGVLLHESGYAAMHVTAFSSLARLANLSAADCTAHWTFRRRPVRADIMRNLSG